MLLVQNNVKKIIVEEKKGIDFRQSDFNCGSGIITLNGDFSNSNFSGFDFDTGFEFHLTGNFDNVDFSNCNLSAFNIQACSFRGTIFTNVINLPLTLNTKSKFIDVVGINNVSAETIWIDGTSILS